MIRFKKNTYLCFVDGLRQQASFNSKSLSNFLHHSGLLRDGFFMPGSYQVLPMLKPEIKQKRTFQFFIYISHNSRSNDLTVSTSDLQENKRTLADNPCGMWRKEKVWNEKGQSELTN